jgi:hypothetical protein
MAKKYRNDEGQIACRVRAFEQPHSFGPHPAGSLVWVDPSELEHPAVNAALLPLEAEDRERDRREAEERAKAEERVAGFERERSAAIAAQNAAKEADKRRRASDAK